MRGASLDELVRGIAGQVTRADAKRIAKLHGHPWERVLKAIKRRGGFRAEPHLAPEYADPAGPSIEESINQLAATVARYGATFDGP